MDSCIKLNYNNNIYTLKRTYGEVSQYSSFIASIPVVESQLGGDVGNILQQPIDINYIKPEEVHPLISYINNPSRQNYKLLTEDLILSFGFAPSPTALWLADDLRKSNIFRETYEELLVWDTSPMEQKLNNIVAFVNQYDFKSVAIRQDDSNTHNTFNNFMKPLEKMLPGVEIAYLAIDDVFKYGTLNIVFTLEWYKDKYGNATIYVPIAWQFTYCFNMIIPDYDCPKFTVSEREFLGLRPVRDSLTLTKELRLSSWMEDMLNNEIDNTSNLPSLVSNIITISGLNDIVLTRKAIEKNNIIDIITKLLDTSTIVASSELDITQLSEYTTTSMHITVEELNTATTIEELGEEAEGEGTFLVIHSDNNIKENFIFIFIMDAESSTHYEKFQHIISGYYRTKPISLYYTL